MWVQPKDGAARAAWRLVAPDSTVYIIPDEHALKALKERLNIDVELHGNLRQLCQYAMAPRGTRGKAENWVLLEQVQWLRRGSDWLQR